MRLKTSNIMMAKAYCVCVCVCVFVFGILILAVLAILCQFILPSLMVLDGPPGLNLISEPGAPGHS